MFRKWKAVVALTLGFNLLWVQTGAADEQPGTAAVKQTVSASSLYDDIITKEAA